MADVVVVGGGITGLVAAREMAAAGARTVLVEPGPLGGKVRSSPFGGSVLDESADAFLARVPDGMQLCRELGLDGDLVSPAQRRALIWSRGGLRWLPQAQVLGVPTDMEELAQTGILSDEGLEAARRDLTEPLVPPADDVAIGSFIRHRLGDEVSERLVDPLVGGINAGDTDALSLAATVPQLDAAARSGAPSMIEACRAQRAAVADPDAAVFLSPRGGMGALVTAVADDVRARGTEVLSQPAVGLERSATSWEVALGNGRRIIADGVVVAAPAGVAAGLVRPHAARAATLLAAIPYASVAMISLAVPRHHVDRELDASGFLVPRREGHAVTACSWTSSKWSHLGDEGTVWLRASVGRDGDTGALDLPDDQLVAAVVRDLRELMDLTGEPVEVRVTRWPASLPQYRPGHLDRVAAVEDDLSAMAPGVLVAGAAMRGLGVPACIRQGRASARRLLAELA